MRRILFPIAILTATVAVFASCQKEAPAPKEGPRELHFIVKATQNSETKTTLTNNGDGTYTPGWSSDDVLGAFFSTTSIKDANGPDMNLTIKTIEGSTAEFEGNAVADGSGDFYAFYPASAFHKGYANGGIGLNIGDKDDDNNYIQHPAVGAPDPSCNILVSKVCEYVSDGDEVVIDDLYFTRPLSILKVNLTGDYANNEEVSSFKLSVSSGILSGRVDINLSNASINGWTVDNDYAWAKYSSSKPVINHATNNTVYLVVNPTTIASGTTITVEAETENYSISKSFTLQSSMSFPANGIAVLNLSIGEDNCSPKTQSTPKVYKRITLASDLMDGSELIIAHIKNGESTLYAVPNAKASKPASVNVANLTGAVVAENKSEITLTDNNTITWNLTWASNGDGWSLNSCSDNAVGLGTTTANDGLSIQSNYKDKPWSISVNSGEFEMKYNETSRYLVVYDATHLRTYNSPTTNKAGTLYLYQLQDDRESLSTPTGLSVSGMTLSWNPVENAGSYLVTINGTEYRVNTSSKEYDGVAGYYNVTVIAIPSNAASFKNSSAATLTDAKFGTPTIEIPVLSDGGVTPNSVKANWTVDQHATNGYHCEIFNGTTKVSEQDVTVGSVTFDGLTEGVTYTVKVNGKAVSGDKPYAASAIATIDLTPDGVHIEDVTAAGSYSLERLTVMAVYNRNIIASDATGSILIYGASNHGIAINDVINVTGTVKAYNGVWEFDGPTMTKTGTTTVVYPSPISYDESRIASYTTTPVVEYGCAIGIADSDNRTVTVAEGKVLNVYGDLSSVDGKAVSLTGYAFGYSSSKVNFMLVGAPTIDPDYATLSVNPSSLSWEASETNDKTISVEVNANGSYSVTTTDDTDWNISDTGSGSITVSPKGQNTSTSDLKTLVITIVHNDNSALSETVTCTQAKAININAKEYTLTLTADSIDAAGSASSGYGKYNGSHTAEAVAADGSKVSVTFVTSQVMPSSNTIQFQAQAGVIYNTVDLGSIKSITTETASGKSDVDVKNIGSTENPRSNSSSGGYFRIGKESKGVANLNKITIVFEK